MREDRSAGGPWVWLFPGTMIVHVAEEAATGETFPDWISRVAGADLSMGEFLALNALAFAVVLVGAVLAVRPHRGGWAIAGLGTAVLTNGVLHLVASVVTGSWSPGVISGTALWVPLGIFALVRTWRRSPRIDLVTGMVIGLLAHGVVALSLALA